MAARSTEVVVQVPEETVAKWRSKLLLYRRYVLFTWRCLSFTSSPLAAVAVWAPVHLTVGLLFAEELPLLAMVGNFLLMTAFFYTLVRFAAHLRSPSEWTGEMEEEYESMCGQLALLDVIVQHGLQEVLSRRKSDPWKFYPILLAIALFVSELGRWISTGLFLQIIVSLILLVPVALEHDWLKMDVRRAVRPAAWQRARDVVVTMTIHYWLLFAGEVPLMAMIGKILLMTIIFYTLVRFAAHLRSPSEWTAEMEDQCGIICVFFAIFEVVIQCGLQKVLGRRNSDPWKYYPILLALVVFVMEIGKWISTGLFLQIIASLVLLVPVVLEHDWLNLGGYITGN